MRLRVEIVEDNVAYFTATKLDNHTQAVFIRLVAKLSNALDLLLFYQLGNPLKQTRFIKLVRDLVNDDRVFAFGLVSDHLGFSPDVDTAATCSIRLNNARTTRDNGSRWEVWPRDITNQVIDF